MFTLTSRTFSFLLALTALTIPFLAINTAPLAAQTLSVADEVTSAPDARVIRTELLEDNSVNTVVTLSATQDTYVASNQANANFGGSDTLSLGYNASGANDGALRILVQFDFPGSIPSDATINSAQMRLYMYASTDASSMDTNVRNLLSSWSEYEVTWNSHEPDWGAIEADVTVSNSPGWVEWDVTDLARQWLNGSAANDGLFIEGNEVPSEHQFAFWSRQAGNGLTPQLVVDYTTSTPDTTPPTSQIVHPQNQYQTSATFRVEWSGSDNDGGSGIAYYDVQYRTPNGSWTDWQLQTEETRAEFTGQDGQTYEFRVRAVDFAGNVESYPDNAEAQTTIDTTPPVATISQLPEFVGVSEFALNWSATDATSGVASYDLQYKFGAAPWLDWLTNTTQTAAQASGENGVRVQYRVRATDGAGNVSSYDAAGATTGTTVDLTAPTAEVLTFSPAETANATFTVRWSGDDGTGSGVGTYDVRYRVNGGPWQNWEQQTTATSASFTAGSGQGVYSFQARATDNVGNVGDYGPTNGTGILFNQGEITLDTYQYMPLAANN